MDHLENVLLGGSNVLRVSDGLYPDLSEAVSESRGKLFFSIVATRVHCSDDTKACFCLDCLPAITTLYPH